MTAILPPRPSAGRELPGKQCRITLGSGARTWRHRRQRDRLGETPPTQQCGRTRMRELRLVGLTKDGRQLLLVDAGGEEFSTPADEKLRAALRGDRARLGQLEIEMDSALRPRDIQARIRSGATPDEVAALAQVPVEQILPYCVPVLAERQHIAELARRSHVRRKNAEGPARQLRDVVSERLRGRDIDPDSVTWDAWRRDDGRWAVQASYLSGESERTGRFWYDPAGRYCVADDDEARWLTGERQPTRKGPQPRPGGRAGERRLAAVPDGGDLLSLPADDDATDDLTAVVRAISGPDPGTRPVSADAGGPDVVVDPDGYPRPDVGPDVAAVEEHAEESAEPPQAAVPDSAVHFDDGDEAPTDRISHRRRRSGKRAAVPSWDEIMLGGAGGSSGASSGGTVSGGDTGRGPSGGETARAGDDPEGGGADADEPRP
jgi:Protein of unknown function (DUF3071)